ncbi:MAG: phage tail protein [Bacteroidetes bacterium]|nr:phage tail protein [Bacteroidota bacterium]
MANPADYTVYPVGFRFELSFQGEDSAFQEVSGLSKELNVEEVVCGGENNFKYKLPTGSVSQNLVLKRAIIPVGSKLMNWCANTLDQGLVLTIVPEKEVILSLLDEQNDPLMQWTFAGAYPVKYSISDFKSTGNEVVIETIELAYTFFKVSKSTDYSGLFKSK